MKKSSFAAITIGAIICLAGYLILSNTFARKKIDKKISLLNKEQKYLRNNWNHFIYLSSFNYQFSKLGGIQEFDIPVRNNTEHLIESMTITVSYIKASGDTFKQELVTTRNGIKTQEAKIKL